MASEGLKPHSHAEREQILNQLVSLWRKKFGYNLLAVAVEASFARGDDQLYSDLEVVVFLNEPIRSHADRIYQRIIDGMLIEAEYLTPEEFVKRSCSVTKDWYIAGSTVLRAVYNKPFVDQIIRHCQAVSPPREVFLRRAAEGIFALQEACGKILNAVEQRNTEGISLLVLDCVLWLLRTLAFFNQRPFTTLSRFIEQARTFAIKPDRFDDLLDLVVRGEYRELDRLGEIIVTVFASVEHLFTDQGLKLYQAPLDPDKPAV